MPAALPQTANEMFNKLQLVNLESVRAQVGATKPDMTDYRRFLALKAAAEKLDPLAFAHCHFSPTPEMDQIWHAHILDTRLYQEACAAMGAKDAFVHHDPHGGDDLDVKKARRAFTQAVWARCYCSLPESGWPVVDVDGDGEDGEDGEEGAGGHDPIDGGGGDDKSSDEEELATRLPKRPRVDDNKFTIFVKTMKGRTLSLSVTKDTTVEDLKAGLHAAGEAPPDQLRVVFAGKQLEDARTMGDYNVRARSTLHMLMRLRGC